MRRALTMAGNTPSSLNLPFCMLTGEIGSGKTTLVRHLIRTLDRANEPWVLISHTHQGGFRLDFIHGPCRRSVW